MLSLEKLRIAVAGVSVTYPLQSALPPSKRAALKAAPSPETMQQMIPMNAFPDAPSFDGVNDKLDMPFAPELNPPSFTLEMWVMVQGGTGYQCILASVGGSPLEGRKGYLFCLTPARQWQFWLGTGQPKAFWQVLSGSIAQQGVWTHLAGTYDCNARTMTFYINGREVGRQADVSYQPNDKNPTRIGAGATEQWGASPCFFNGRVAEVHVWDRVLKPIEIQALAAQQSIEVQAESISPDSPMATQRRYHSPPQPDAASNLDDADFSAMATEAQTGNTVQAETEKRFFSPTTANPVPQLSTPPLQQSVESAVPRPPIVEKPLVPKVPNTGTAAMPDSQNVLWQIGKPGQSGTPASTGKWTPVYHYTVGTDPDPLNRPTIPACLVPANTKTIPNSTSELNIHFILMEDYTEEQLILCYDRYGSGEDHLFLDGQLLATTPGAGKGKLKQSNIPFGAVRQGPHTISITTSTGAASAHLIDYLQLQIHKPMLSNLTSQLGGLTGGSKPPSTGNQSQSSSQPSTGQPAPASGSGLLSGLTSQGGAGGLVGGLTNQASGLSGGLPVAGGLVGGLTGQGGAGGLVGGLAGGLPVAGGLVGGLTGQGSKQGSGGGDMIGGLLGQVGGLAGGLPVAGGLVGGLTGQGGSGGGAGGLASGLLGQVGGLAGGLPVAGGLVGGLTGQGGGAGGDLVGGLLGQVGGLAGGLPVAGGLVGGLTGQGGLANGLLGQVGGLAGGLPVAGGLLNGLGGVAGGMAQGGYGSGVEVAQLTALVQQLTVLVAQLTQILAQLGVSAQPGMAGMLPNQQLLQQAQQLQQMQQLQQAQQLQHAQLSQISAMTGIPAAQLAQVAAQTGLTPPQLLAQLQQRAAQAQQATGVTTPATAQPTDLIAQAQKQQQPR